MADASDIKMAELRNFIKSDISIIFDGKLDTGVFIKVSL
jgi:hypothetical protein